MTEALNTTDKGYMESDDVVHSAPAPTGCDPRQVPDMASDVSEDLSDCSTHDDPSASGDLAVRSAHDDRIADLDAVSVTDSAQSYDEMEPQLSTFRRKSVMVFTTEGRNQ